MKTTLRSLALLSALALHVTPAAAQDDAAKRDAQARFEEGMKRVRSGDYEGGRLAFVQSYAVLKNPDILWNLALSEFKSNHPLDALGHFKAYAAETRVTGDERERAKRYIAEASTKVGHIAVDAPEGAEISLDGRGVLGVCPLREAIDVEPGKHAVEARVGGKASVVEVFANAGQESSAKFRAEDMTATAASSVAPPPPPAVEPPPSAPEHASSARWITAGILGAGALIAGGTAIGFAVGASNAGSRADAFPADPTHTACAGSMSQDCRDLHDNRQSQIDDKNRAVFLGVAAGALAVAAVVTIVIWPKRSSGASAATIAPAVGPGFSGAQLRATF